MGKYLKDLRNCGIWEVGSEEKMRLAWISCDHVDQLAMFESLVDYTPAHIFEVLVEK